MKLLFIFTFLLAKGSSQCPIQCKCTDTSILCDRQALTEVPLLATENNPAIIDLSGNQFTFLDIGDLDFPKSKNVIELFLNNSAIVDITDGVFHPLENLQELYLGSNYISSIPENIVSELEDIILLEMSNNYFTENMPIIRSDSLEVLSLANSKISNIPENGLSYLPSLKLLLLQQNDIKTISMEVFHTVPADSLFVRLSYNPWPCNCPNMELFKFLDTKSFVDPSDPYECLLGDMIIDIYGKSGKKYMQDNCKGKTDLDNNLNESRAMIDENRQNLDNFLHKGQVNVKITEEKRFEDIFDKSAENFGERCNNSLTNFNFYLILVTSTISGFLFGGILAILCYSFNGRYRKLEQTSDSKVELLQ